MSFFLSLGSMMERRGRGEIRDAHDVPRPPLHIDLRKKRSDKGTPVTTVTTEKGNENNPTVIVRLDEKL